MTISIADLLMLPQPPHWPRSSYYSVRSALRVMASIVPIHESFPIEALPGILDHAIAKYPGTRPQGLSLKTYRSRILRFTAEYMYGQPLRRWEARWFFEHLTKAAIRRRKEDTHG